MLRNLGILVVGALLGGLAAWLLLNDPSATGTTTGGPRSLLTAITGIGERDATAAVDLPSVAASLAVYREATTDSAASLEASIARLAQAPPTAERDIELDAVLTRLADLDPALAVSLALEHRVDTPFVVSAFRYWAELDAAAALDGLTRLQAAATRRAVAVGLLDVFGDSQPAAERVADALPNADAIAFRTEWLQRRAKYDPLGALRDATTSGDISRRYATIRSVAEVLAEQDPLGALAHAYSLSGSDQQSFKNAVANEWARLDPVGFLAYVESGGADTDVISGGFRWIAAADIDLALDVSDRLSGTAGDALRQTVLWELATVDPDAALARIDAMPIGQERLMMQQQVASRYAMVDPRAAYEWALNLDPPAPDIMSMVVQGIVQRDFALAAEILADPPPGVDTRSMASMIGIIGMNDPTQAAEAADGLLRQDAPLARETLSSLVSGWMRRDEEGAVEWVVANAAELDSRTLGQAAQAMARRDPRAAAALVDQVPPASRADWITQVAGPYAAYDPDGAIAWIAQYQGNEAYEPAYRQIIMQLSTSDAQMAATMLRQASGEVQLGAASRVASALAAENPRTAMRWASELTDARAREAATGSVVSTWARNDLTAARSYTLEMEEGVPRDRALAGIVSNMASNGDFDPELLDRFSSETERQQALTGLIPVLAREDPTTAWQLFDDEIVNPNQRRQIEERMQQLGISR